MKSYHLIMPTLLGSAWLAYAQAPQAVTAEKNAAKPMSPQLAEVLAKAQNTQVISTSAEVYTELAPSLSPESTDEDPYIRRIVLTFSAPMVEKGSVGHPCAEGMVQLDSGLTYTTQWLARNVLEITTDRPQRMTVYQLSLNPALRGLKGEPVACEPIRFAGESIRSLGREWGLGIGEPQFIISYDSGDDPFISKALPQAYHRLLTPRQTKGKRVQTGTRPARIRPATIGDILTYWDQLYEGLQLRESDLEVFAAKPADEELPGVWYVAAEQVDDDTVTELVLPGCGDFNAKTGAFEDYVFDAGASDFNRVWLSNQRVDTAQYQVSLQLTPPLDGETLDDVMDQFRWSIQKYDKDAAVLPMEYRDGAFSCKLGEDVVKLTLDKEATLAKAKAAVMADGSTRQLVRELIWRADTAGHYVKLTIAGLPVNINGTHYEMEADAYNKPYVIGLRPKRPVLRSNVIFSSINGANVPALACEVEDVQHVKLRAWRLENSPANAVRNLQTLRRLYTAAKLKPTLEDLKKQTIVPTQQLSGILAEAATDVRTVEQKAQIPLTDLFADAKRGGLFFVEFSGDALNDGGADGQLAKIYTQGLIQVTDLGLMWKSWQQHCMVYAYQLSSGQPVAEGSLRLLDENGGVMHEVEVREGLAALPAEMVVKQPAYLQLVSGDDCYFTEFSNPKDESEGVYRQGYRLYWMQEYLQDHAPEHLPMGHIFVFQDRSLYRPGEVVHFRGYIRDITGTELSIPHITGVKAIVYKQGGRQEYQATLDADGAFHADIPVESGSSFNVSFECEYAKDASGQRPLLTQALALAKDQNPQTLRNIRERVESVERTDSWVRVAEFRRNEFEVKSEMSLNTAGGAVTLKAHAAHFTTTPVANGQVDWRLETQECNFYPAGYEQYRFGDYRDYDYDYFCAYYGDGRCNGYNHESRMQEGLLDETGAGKVSFMLPESERRRIVRGYVSVTNSNQQTIGSHCSQEVHPADLYVGLKATENISKVGQPIPVTPLLLKPDATPYQGEDLTGEISVTRVGYDNYRIGSRFIGQIRHVERKTEVLRAPLTLTGKKLNEPAFQVPTSEPGIYDITVRGMDAKGKRFSTVTRHYVYGEGQVPWFMKQNHECSLIPNKDMYTPGETAQLMLQTPVDGDVLVTIEREGVRRSFRTKVTATNPIIHVPLEAGDAPMVVVSAFLIQGADAADTANGLPIILSANTTIHVDPSEKRLAVELNAPTQMVLPNEECTVSGVVRDAEGKPVPHALVTLYAEDEGTLQVCGYEVPNPFAIFFSHDVHGVTTYDSRNQLVGKDLALTTFGNKGTFIGGGEGMAADSAEGYVRANFAPCALWLPSVRTDAHGRFSATFRNPDTLTRYRLMAVVAAGKDQFGMGRAYYHVVNPIMLEPATPFAAACGDKLSLPVTLSMLPEQIPGLADGGRVRWKVSAKAENAAISQPSYTVELQGTKPITLQMPVTLNSPGTATLTWEVKAVDDNGRESNGELARLRDAVRLSFPVEPAVPHLREAISHKIMPGQRLAINGLLQQPFHDQATVTLNFSTHPLSPIAGAINYLFTYPHGCVEQLCSTLMPWLLADQLQKIPGVEFPERKSPALVAAETIERILECRMFGRYQNENVGFSYWAADKDRVCEEFTPYVLTVLQVAQAKGLYQDEYEHFRMLNQLKKELLTKKFTNLQLLLPLAMSKNLTGEEIRQVLQQYPNADGADLWIAAIAARKVGAAIADELAEKASHTPLNAQTISAPVAILRLMYRYLSSPGDTDVQHDICRYVQEFGGRSWNTWENGWLCLLLCEVLDKQAEENEALLNGSRLAAGQLIRKEFLVGEAATFQADGAPVYAFGMAEGYVKEQQPDALVDRGFITTRIYEVLQPDGTWRPTPRFHVGDVVRVTLQTSYTGQEPARYAVIEDRLPSTFELVNPQLATQTLPPDLLRKAMQHEGWQLPSWFSNMVPGKDRISFYVNHWTGDKATIRYVARVVRSGSVSAPAAKAELMYQPQVYGLSTPEKVEVAP